MYQEANGLSRTSEQRKKEEGCRTRYGVWGAALLVITPAVTASAPVGTATTVIAPTTTAPIITTTAVRAAASVHALAAARAAAIAVMEDPIRPLALGNLVLNSLQIHPALLDIGAAPLDFTRKVAKLC